MRVLLVLALVAIPMLRDERAASRSATCESLWLALRPEVASELDRVLSGDTTLCGSTSGNTAVVSCSLTLHGRERNPRNRAQVAFTTSGDVASNLSSCRVGLVMSSTNGIRFNQYVTPDASGSRTFTIAVE